MTSDAAQQLGANGALVLSLPPTVPSDEQSGRYDRLGRYCRWTVTGARRSNSRPPDRDCRWGRYLDRIPAEAVAAVTPFDDSRPQGFSALRCAPVWGCGSVA